MPDASVERFESFQWAYSVERIAWVQFVRWWYAAKSKLHRTVCLTRYYEIPFPFLFHSVADSLHITHRLVVDPLRFSPKQMFEPIVINQYWFALFLLQYTRAFVEKRVLYSVDWVIQNQRVTVIRSRWLTYRRCFFMLTWSFQVSNYICEMIWDLWPIDRNLQIWITLSI